jgi:hypothetical protein
VKAMATAAAKAAELRVRRIFMIDVSQFSKIVSVSDRLIYGEDNNPDRPIQALSHNRYHSS